MAVGVVDDLDVINIDQRNHAFLMLVLVLALGELKIKQVLPRAMIEQAGQAVGAAELAQDVAMFPELERDLMVHPANEDGVDHQNGQTGIDLRHVAVQVDDGVEHRQRDQHTQCLGAKALQHKARACSRHVVHGHHGDHGDAWNGTDPHCANPESAHQRIEQYVAPFGQVGLG